MFSLLYRLIVLDSKYTAHLVYCIYNIVQKLLYSQAVKFGYLPYLAI